MNKRIVEKYIPFAIRLLENEIENDNRNIVNDKDKKILNKVYNAYIAAFGANIIQNGLAPAIAFYKNENASSEKSRAEVVNLIEKILKEDSKIDKDKSLFDMCLEKETAQLTEDTINATIALKLAFRTYKLKKEE